MANCLTRELAPFAVNLPLILDRLPQLLGLNVVPHRKACIVFAIYESGGCRNRASGHNFGDKNHSPSVFAALFPANVEAQIYLIEIGMKRHRDTPK